MSRGKGLTQCAGVVSINRFIGHTFDALIPVPVDYPGLFDNLFNIFLLGVELHLEFVENTAEVLVQFGMQDGADIFQFESFFPYNAGR